MVAKFLIGDINEVDGKKTDFRKEITNSELLTYLKFRNHKSFSNRYLGYGYSFFSNIINHI